MLRLLQLTIVLLAPSVALAQRAILVGGPPNINFYPAHGSGISAPSGGGACCTYYVDQTGGNDLQDGRTITSPWKTLAKVNAQVFPSGTSVLLKRGESWAEQLTPAASGSSGSPIVFGAYGTGAPPRITGGAKGIDTNGKNYLTFSGLMIDGKQLYVNASSGVTANYTVVKRADSDGINAVNSPSTTLNNVTVAGSLRSGVVGNGATTAITIKNALITGNATEDSSTRGGIEVLSGASVTYSYSLITGNNADPTKNILAGATDGGNNQTAKLSGITRHIADAVYGVATVDDSTNSAYASDIAGIFAGYGGHITWNVNGGQTFQPTAGTLGAAGHEIGNHSWSHSYATTTDALGITSTNTTPTVNVDVAGQQLILSCTEVGNRVTVSWAGGDKSITDLKTAVSGKGWTINTTANINDTAKLPGLTDTAGAQSVPRTLTWDQSAPNYPAWREEWTDTDTLVNALVGVTPTTLTWPGGVTAAGVQAWAQGKGYLGARGTSAVWSRLSSVNLFNVNVGASLKGDGAEATIRANARHEYEFSRMNGGAIFFYAHSTAEYTNAQAGYFADEFGVAGLTFGTFASFASAIRADHSTADNITYTKTYSDVSDFSLKASSPCVNAGVAVAGLSTDILGNPIVGAPDCGAYERQ